MDNEVLVAMITTCVPSLATVFNVIYTNIKTRHKRMTEQERAEQEQRDKIRNSVAKGMRFIMRENLIAKCKKYIKKGRCPIHIKQEMEEEYTLYHDELKGNGTVTALYNRFLALDFTDSQEDDDED